MSYNVVLLHLLVFVTISITSASQVRTGKSPKCRIELSRAVGPQNYYTLICKCASFFEAKSVATAPAPPPKLDTQGRTDATLDCIKSQEGHLIRSCARLNASEFSEQISPVLKHCTETRLNKQQSMDNGPVVYDSSTCLSKVAFAIYGTTAEINWLCECNQGGIFEVTPGWARYYLKGTNASLKKDIAFMRNCLNTDAGKKMSKVCTESAGDYYVQGLQSIETCCKRLQANSDKKFECQKITPGNLGDLKVEF